MNFIVLNFHNNKEKGFKRLKLCFNLREKKMILSCILQNWTCLLSFLLSFL